MNIINKAIPDNRESWLENTEEYFRVSSELSTIGPVVFYSEKMIIPTAPRLRLWKCCTLPTRTPQG